MAVTEQAVILAGGLGTRLGELTRAVPKPLPPVNGTPFIAHLINNLRRLGFMDVVLLVGCFSEQFTPLAVPGRFGEVRVRLSVEPPSLLGTAGALLQADSLLAERADLSIPCPPPTGMYYAASPISFPLEWLQNPAESRLHPGQWKYGDS